MKFDKNYGFLMRYWTKLLADKIAHSLMLFFIDLQKLQFFKVINPEVTIVTGAVTKS